MKINNLTIYVCLCAVLTFISCDKLNKLPPNTLVAENAITDESTAEAAVNGIYSYFGAYNELNAFSITTQALRIKFVDASTMRSTYELEVAALAVNPSWIYLKNLWVNIFEVINAANYVINQLDKFNDDDFSQGKRKQLLGEAYFLRGYAHLFQMKMFAHFWDINSEYGPLIRIEPSGLNNNRKARSTVSEGYEQILSDLRFASENAPDFFSVFESSKSLAKAYIVETLLMRGSEGDFTEAANIADDLIKNGPVELVSTYPAIYSTGYQCGELMFTRIIKPENIGLQDLVSANVASAYSLLGRKMNKPSETYLEFIPASDTRLQHTIGVATAANNVTYTDTWIKHFEITGDVPIRFMRLTQMYIYLAEALYRSGAETSAVLAPLNILRQRAGMPLYQEDEILVYKDLEGIIFYELVAELGVENGSEYFAAVRFKNNIGERLIKEFNPAYINDNQLALPIPDDELIFNPSMKQNP